MSEHMMMMLWWYVSGLIGSGFLVAQWDSEDDEFGLSKKRQNLGFGVLWALYGPIALILGFCLTGFGQYGWWWFRVRGVRP